MTSQYGTDILEDILVDNDTHTGVMSELVVYNDDYNTFEWVIECFMEVLSHSSEQAEQLSMIIHYKGKATVKTASVNVLRPFKDELVDRGLSAVIETVAV